MFKQLKGLISACKIHRADTSRTGLEALYRSMSDESLRRIDASHLTAEALPLWQTEMNRRNLVGKAM